MTHPHTELIAYLEGMPEPHILFDTDYRIISANAAYRQQFGAEQVVVGRRCYEVSHHIDVPCDQAGEACPLARSRLSGQRERVLHLHHTPKGEAYINIELTPLPSAAGNGDLYIEKMEPLPMARSAALADGLVGRSPAFRHMLSLVARVAPSGTSVLLLGESGTGKELMARAVHEASPRSHKALVVVDCASLPETLFESELFGHERGAFTGASAAKEGLVELASGGTLFLDEVGDIPLAMQVKLLRLLETGTFRRVGSTELRRCDLRVVAATHRDLAQRVKQGLFREDLYFRLCVFPVRVPPLRERPEDFVPLSEALLERVAGKRRIRLSNAALALLMQQRFPGNVRELRNLLERCTLLCDGDVIEAAHVYEALFGGATATLDSSAIDAEITGHGLKTPETTGLGLKAHSAHFLQEQLALHRGTRAELARQLGISERSLYRKLRALGLDKS